MNKEIKYKDYTFNIKVELNYRTEKVMNGQVWHKVTANCMDASNYYKADIVKDEYLEQYLITAEHLIRKYVEERDHQEPVDERLTKLGYK